MLQQLPTIAFAPWTTTTTTPITSQSTKGASLVPGAFKMSQLPVLKTDFNGLELQFGHLCTLGNGTRRPGIFCCADRSSSRGRRVKKREVLPQNVDLPQLPPKQKKKPYPIPLKKIQQAAKADKKLAEMGIEKPLEPPKNGILVPELIPLAYEVFDAWKVLIKGLAQLMHVVPVHACR